MHEWTATFERYWRHQLNRMKERAEDRTRATKSGPASD